MSKLSRHTAIREIVTREQIASQDELRRRLYRIGHRVTQATLSRDLSEIGVVKSADGYALPDTHDESDLRLPSLERLVREFVYEVRTAQNIVVVKTSAGSAQPVAAAMDAEGWPEAVGTVGGDDTIFIVAPDNTQAQKLVTRIKELLA